MSNHDEKIKALEGELEAEEAKIQGLMISGQKIIAPENYVVIDRIRKELKAARIARTKEATRGEPKFERQITVGLSEEDFQRLTDEAAAAKITLPKYIRHLLKSKEQSGD